MVKDGESLHPQRRMGGFLGRFAVSKHKKPPFEPMWQAARPRVWGLTARLCGSVDIADDLTQEIAILALRGYETFRGDSRTLTWLFRIAIHAVLRHREKTRATQTNIHNISLEELEENDSLRLQVPTSEQPENRLLNAEPNLNIRRALNALPDELRTPLILYVYEEMKCREIAETLAVPLGTVLSRLHTARQRMKSALVQEFRDED